MDLVSGSLTRVDASKEAPAEIVYIPVGSHTITPSVNGKAKKVTVNVPADKGAVIAANLQAALDRRNAASIRPRIGFDHVPTGPASGKPKSFRFDPEVGIVLALDWSNSGKAAVEGGDYGYFSPTFLIAADGTPADLPNIGEIGSLVNEPAFRAMKVIAAADQSHADDPAPTPTNTMNLLVQCRILTEAEASQENATELATTRYATLKASYDEAKKDAETKEGELKAEKEKSEKLEGEKTAAVSALNALVTASVDNEVAEAVKEGKIRPADETTKGFWKGQLVSARLAPDADASKAVIGAFGALPKINAGLTEPFKPGNSQKKEGESEEVTGTDRLACALAEEAEAANK